MVPCTCWLTMVRPPSAISAQLGPRLPLARAKLSEGSPAPPLPPVVVVVDGVVVVVVVLGGMVVVVVVVLGVTPVPDQLAAMGGP